MFLRILNGLSAWNVPDRVSSSCYFERSTYCSLNLVNSDSHDSVTLMFFSVIFVKQLFRQQKPFGRKLNEACYSLTAERPTSSFETILELCAARSPSSVFLVVAAFGNSFVYVLLELRFREQAGR